MNDHEREPEAAPEATPDERIEDLDVPESDSEDVKGGYGSTTSTASGTGGYGPTWGTKK